MPGRGLQDAAPVPLFRFHNAGVIMQDDMTFTDATTIIVTAAP